MHQCACGGFVPGGVRLCPNCGAVNVRPRAATMLGLAAAAQLITACACYGGPVTCRMIVHRGAPVNSCTAAFDCTTPLPDGGQPTQDPADGFCFTGPIDAGP